MIFHTDSINDGGTKVYYGLGYQIIVWNQLSDDGNEILSKIEAHFIIGIIDPLNDKEDK